MPAAITILYEDQRGATKGFGLHAFVKACVLDVINGERRHVETALDDARPLKGVTNVLHACRVDIDLIAADGRSVVAVIDDDAIRHHLKLPRDASDARVEQEIKKGSRAPAQLSIVLLKRNTESVLEAAATCDPTLDAERLVRAIEQKDLLERDTLFAELSRERARPIRDCILGRMPSLRALVDLLGGMLTGAVPAPRGAPAAPAGKRKKPSRSR
jgi:hypothetical protein